MRSWHVVLLSSLILTGCSKDETDGITSTHVTMPSGKKVTVEIMRQTIELMKGMMFRDSLAEDHGMLFVHPKEDKIAYWMYETRIPLDIIWMDRSHKIVEVSANTPPCKTEAAQCPKYGGTEVSAYVLELNGGAAAKYGLKVGDVLQY